MCIVVDVRTLIVTQTYVRSATYWGRSRQCFQDACMRHRKLNVRSVLASSCLGSLSMCVGPLPMFNRSLRKSLRDACQRTCRCFLAANLVASAVTNDFVGNFDSSPAGRPLLSASPVGVGRLSASASRALCLPRQYVASAFRQGRLMAAFTYRLSYEG